MYQPHPGDLNEKISIYRVENDINENGYPEAREVSLYSQIWADVKDASSSYNRAADTDVATVGMHFIIRYRTGIKRGNFVKWNDESYLITDIGEFEHKHDYLELFVRLVEGVR